MLQMKESVLSCDGKKQRNLGLPTSKLPATTKILLRLTC